MKFFYLLLLFLPLIGFSQNTTIEKFNSIPILTNDNEENSFDSICLTPIVSSFPYSESFDTLIPNNFSIFSCVTSDNLTGCWTNDPQNDSHWTARSIASNTAGTGPSSDNSGSGNYVYLEASSCTYISYLNSPMLDFSSSIYPNIEFYYHMFGNTVGTLALEASTDGTNWTTLWSLSGSQLNFWLRWDVDLSAYAGSPTVYLRFMGDVSTGFSSDLGLDDISIFTVPSQTVDFNSIKRFELFPNPTSGALKLELETNESVDLTIRIFNALGQSIDQRVLNNVIGNSTQEFDFNHLPKGIYLIELSDGNRSITKKLILQ